MYDIAHLYQAESPLDACRLKREHPEAVIIAGGSDVLIKMREGRLAGTELISIYQLDEMRGVEILEDGTIRIGSLSSFTSLNENPILLEKIPALAYAVGQVGGPQVRNIGTIGGNTCNGVTSADSASTLLAYDAEVEILSEEGTRIVPLKDFYLKAGKVDLREGEIQRALRIRRENYESYYGCYIKYAMRNAMDIATLSCSANFRLREDGRTIDILRVAYGVAGPVPLRSPSAEAFASGLEATEENFQAIAKEALKDEHSRDSWRASKEFRQHLIQVCLVRALRGAFSAAKEAKHV